MSKTKLLIVDDNPVIRQGLRSLLEAEEQLEVSGEASTGAEAIQWMKKHSADVILMDIRMPIIDGIDATTEILRSHPQAKILILTVTEDPKTLARTLHAGARGYLVYSRFDPDELLKAVYTVASGEEIAPSPAVLTDPRRARLAGAGFRRSEAQASGAGRSLACPISSGRQLRP